MTIVLTLASLAMCSPLSFTNYETSSETVASFDNSKYGKSTRPGEIVVAGITKWRYKHQGLDLSDIFISYVSHFVPYFLFLLQFESNYTGIIKLMKLCPLTSYGVEPLSKSLIDLDPCHDPVESSPAGLNIPLGKDSKNSRRNGTQVEIIVTVCRTWLHIIQGHRLIDRERPSLSNPFTWRSWIPDTTIFLLHGSSSVSQVRCSIETGMGDSQYSNT